MDYSYAVVTGASSGIGAEVCRLLCESGVFVYGVGRDFSKNKFSHRAVLPYRTGYRRYEGVEGVRVPDKVGKQNKNIGELCGKRFFRLA